MRVPPTPVSLCLSALSLSGCSASSTPNAALRDGGTERMDATSNTVVDARMPPEAGSLPPRYECDAGPEGLSPDAVFFRAKHVCERPPSDFFAQCGTFHLTFDATGRAAGLTRDKTFGPLPAGYAECILNEAAHEAYDCLAGASIAPYESCTLL